ncbi:polyamine deacetylase HDAC10-like isoform X2 [Erythrolamprus reginae]|uniref:polyamine deacetylase HDAC10-like isoform X2 n=1 Tax=Erythrolamprus reginae TaxID=121349 RepID=UPI00396C53FB
MAAGTALVYDGEMTNHKLLWEDPNCNLEVPERLSSCYDRLQHYNLIERCISVSAREGTESEIMLIHSMDYVEIVKSTEKMEKEELQKVSADYDAVYFHPTTYHCAKLAVGATLQLVDAVMSGKARNGLTLIRPPGHHSQRSEANGFCIFNNVAIAAKYAQRNYGLQRILIVDWDIHHGQGIQYAFDDDPSVLYFSWHRFEHQNFWPWLRESNYDAVGQGKGRGFNINVPWNQVGMGNSDYLAAVLHVLLPIAFEFDPELVLISAGYDSGIGDPEGQMKATPECFSHLTHFLMNLAHGKLCAVLEGGYHLRSLSESVCMTLKALLGDPLPPLSGEMMPCLRVLCVFVGDMDMKIELDDDKVLLINICRKRSEQVNTKHNVSLNWKEDPKTNNFFSATFGFILPVAYSYQPNLTIVIIGPNQNLGKNRISLLISLLQGLAECQILAVIQDTEEKIMQDIANILTGDFIPTFGNFAPDLQENVEGMKELRAQFQQEWKLLQCSCSAKNFKDEK